MRTNFNLYLLTLLLLATGCNVFEQNEERVAIAQVKEHELYLDELKSALPEELTSEDSTLFADNFIDQWATQTLLLDKAELNLTNEEKDVSGQLEEYRRSLLIYLYQKQLIRQLLDTVVTGHQIELYYNNNKQNFELQDNIVRVIFVKLDKNTKEVEKLKKLCRSDKESDRQELEEYCVQHATAFHLNDQQWIPFGEIMGQLPKTSYLNLNYFSTYGFAQVQDSTAQYMLDVKEIKPKNSISPLAFEKHNIRNILLNQRKLELVKKMEKDIFDEAVSKNQFQIFTD